MCLFVCLKIGVRCVLFLVSCFLSLVSWSLFVVRCSLFVACLLHDVCFSVASFLNLKDVFSKKIVCLFAVCALVRLLGWPFVRMFVCLNVAGC